MYTYEDLCKKIGFDPLITKPPVRDHDVIDDRPNPFSILTYEEATAFEKMYKERLAKIVSQYLAIFTINRVGFLSLYQTPED